MSLDFAAGKKITKGKVSKIVGLDPAGPSFKYEDVDKRLADTDASYVEVIYTCAGKLAHTEPLGANNFYPNGGRSQPGCGWDLLGTCAHGRAYEFFLESIINPQFFAFECDSLDNLRKGNCSVINEVKQMGGEPGNKRCAAVKRIFGIIRQFFSLNIYNFKFHICVFAQWKWNILSSNK